MGQLNRSIRPWQAEPKSRNALLFLDNIDLDIPDGLDPPDGLGQ
jgi:hypothetical protein